MVSPFRTLGQQVTRSIRALTVDERGQRFRNDISRYELLERYYWNDQYEIVNGAIAAAKATKGLYRNIRPIRNPIKRAVDWYPGNLFPGTMTPDGLPLPDGTPSCLGFSSDTDEEVRLAMNQTMLWANWGTERWAVGRNLPMLGDQFGEVHVDYDRMKVYPRFLHPSFVDEMEWNGSGDIIMYHLEIPSYDVRSKRPYSWGKVVTKETITTLYNGEPHSYNGLPAKIPNPWGFCPAAWCQFRNVGGYRGGALSDGVTPKIDELNNILSPIHDYIMKFSNQGIIFKSDKKLKDFLAGLEVTGPTADRANPQSGRSSLHIMKVPIGTDVDRPLQNMGLADAVAYCNDLAAEIESDLPESTLDEKISSLSQPPSGRALAMMFGGAEKRLDEAKEATISWRIKLMQMCVSIGGELANSGAWGLQSSLSAQQALFLPFDLSSYDRGDLEVTIISPPLFEESADERTSTVMMKEQVKTIQGLREVGYTDEEIFGVGQVPETIPGILEQRNQAAQAAADAFARTFNSGGAI